jgi:uncharacterized protein (DUF2132 family)
MGEEHPHDPMYGVKLEQIVNELVQHHRLGGLVSSPGSDL